MTPLELYRMLEERLRALHARDPEVDEVLDQMDAVWWKLSEEERTLLNSEPVPGEER